MKNWRYFWQNYRDIEIKTQDDLLFQVGKTVKGKVISQEQLNNDLNEIKSNLNLNKSDILLDLCCGNGVLSLQLSKSVDKIIGLDFSETYIQNAKTYSQSENIEYFSVDILDDYKLKKVCDTYNITKVLMNDCLAYFKPNTLEATLKTLSEFNIEILLSSILDKKRKWQFYNTLIRKWAYVKDVLFFNNNSGLGYWWKKAQIKEIAKRNNFSCEFYSHHKDNHTAHYRFNAKLIKV